MSEDLRDFRGLNYRAPVMVLTLSIFLLSLLGIPPLAGFMAKFQIFSVMYNSAEHFRLEGELGLSKTMYALLVIGGLNTVVSAMYYIKVLRVMILDKSLEEVEGRPVVPLKVPGLVSGYACVLAAVIVGLGIFWNGLSAAALRDGVSDFPSAVPEANHARLGSAKGMH